MTDQEIIWNAFRCKSCVLPRPLEENSWHPAALAPPDWSYYEAQLRDYQSKMFDVYFSKKCHPGHTLSKGAVADLPNRYYDYDNKPWLYNRLQEIKRKYDPNGLLSNLSSIS